MTFQRMDGSTAGYGTDFKAHPKTVALTKYDDKKWKGGFTFEEKVPDQLTLDGNMGGHKINMRLKLVASDKFQLVSRRFHWTQEYPFNRSTSDPFVRIVHRIGACPYLAEWNSRRPRASTASIDHDG
jgi:hypothetical protein